MLNRPASPAYLFSFGHYQVLTQSLLGRGYNSLAYEGINTITGEHVCIKRIHLANNIQHQLFLNEVSCLRTIQHPNVLRYLHHFQISNYAYIVTELCQENLFTKIFRKGRLQDKQALAWFLQILSGYEEIRKKDFLHRDLKPQNIFIKDGRLKIGDFGFCLKLRTREIKERYNVGSPLYMAPQVLQQNIYSQKSDVWSLGILLYEMLHGQNPFKSKWQKDLINEMRRKDLKCECHPFLDGVLKGALAYNKENRYSLKDFKQKITSIISSDSGQPSQGFNRTQRLISNQIQYVKFMEYVKILSSKCRRPSRSQRIIFLFQYSIRMRFSLIEKLKQESPISSRLLNDELALLKDRHCQQLRAPIGLDEGDRLRFLDPNQVIFDYFALWQIQAELKDTLAQILKNCPQLLSEVEVAKNEDQLRLIDFLLTAYVLNRILIQSQSNLEQFFSTAHLGLILTRPQRINIEVYRSIILKCKDLRLI